MLRCSNESSRARSAAEHIPDHAGAAYPVLDPGDDDGVEYAMQRCGRSAMLAQHSHRVQQAGA